MEEEEEEDDEEDENAVCSCYCQEMTKGKKLYPQPEKVSCVRLSVRDTPVCRKCRTTINCVHVCTIIVTNSLSTVLHSHCQKIITKEKTQNQDKDDFNFNCLIYLLAIIIEGSENPHHNVNPEMRYQSVSGVSVLWKSSAGMCSESELFLLCVA